MADLTHNYALAVPEIFLACAAMALLMIGVFRGNDSTRLVAWLSVGALIVTAIFALNVVNDAPATFAGMFVVDKFAVFAKIIIIVGTALAVGIASSGAVLLGRIGTDQVPWGWSLALVAGVVIGAQIGSRLSQLTPRKVLRKYYVRDVPGY